MVAGAPGGDVFKIGFKGNSGTTVKTDFCTVGSAIRKRTMKSGVTGKRMDWAGCEERNE